MNILLKAKKEVEAHFGKKATMATNLLNMVGQGEKAFGFLTGDMDAGFEITVGFFNRSMLHLEEAHFSEDPRIRMGLGNAFGAHPPLLAPSGGAPLPRRQYAELETQLRVRIREFKVVKYP